VDGLIVKLPGPCGSGSGSLVGVKHLGDLDLAICKRLPRRIGRDWTSTVKD